MFLTPVRLNTILACMVPFAAVAQTPGLPLEWGRSFALNSAALGRRRVVDISVPRGYAANTSQRYPVFVVLDGDFELEPAAAVSRFYAGVGQLPEAIVVGVRNTDRTWDFTPPPVPGYHVPPEVDSAGGADRFLEFLADDLLPYLDRHYRTAPLRVLVGHSLGGLFALYAMDRRPDLFTGYLVMEPSVWWNDGKEFVDARVSLQSPRARRVRLLLVNTQPLGVDTTQWGGSRPMVRQLSTNGETHESMALEGMAQGLRVMFADFRPTGWIPGQHPIEMLSRYDSLVARVGYAPPIPVESFSMVTRMSIDGRYFDDAEAVLNRWDRTYGPSSESRDFREHLRQARVTPPPAGLIPLVVPSHRPSAQDAKAFLGRWVTAGPERHEVEIRAVDDTIAVHDRIQTPDGSWIDSDGPVIQVTSEGTLEWGLPFFQGLPALVVVMGRVQPDGTMLATREPRGWVPRQPGADLSKTERFRRE